MSNVCHWFHMGRRGITAAAVLAGLMLLLALPALVRADILKVDMVTDSAAAVFQACTPAPDDCSLRGAILKAESTPGTDSIHLQAETYVLTEGWLEIRTSLDLYGVGIAQTFIDGNLASQVIGVLGEDHPTVVLVDVTIQNGRGIESQSGGGLYAQEGATVVLLRCRVRDNATDAPGGGIANYGFMEIADTIVENNQVPSYRQANPVTGGVQHSGGGINNGNFLRLQWSSVINNRATRGGGILTVKGSHLEIHNSTISGNFAYARGGGIMNWEGTALIAFSTITNNETDGFPEDELVGGGGIYQTSTNSNKLFMGNSILAGNRNNLLPDSSPDCASTEPAHFTSFRGNLIGVLDDNCHLVDAEDEDTLNDQAGTLEVPLAPGLDPLTFNGRTYAHLLHPDSPARDTGTGTIGPIFFDCPPSDQGHATRPTDGDGDGMARCDAGAIEAPAARER